MKTICICANDGSLIRITPEMFEDFTRICLNKTYPNSVSVTPLAKLDFCSPVLAVTITEFLTRFYQVSDSQKQIS